MKRIILVGFMGSGKSTIGKKIAEELDLPFFEMDIEVEKKANKSIPMIFEIDGEVAFRQLETDILKEAIQQDGVIATGGGTVTQAENLELLKKENLVVYLKGDIDSLMANISNDKKNKRPLADKEKKESLSNLLNQRESYYQAVADIVLIINNKKVEELVEELVTKIKGMAS